MNDFQHHISKPLYGITLFTAFWSFLLLQVMSDAAFVAHSIRFKNHLVAFIHDSLAVILPVLMVWPYIEGAGGINTANEKILMNLSTGYLIADGVFWIVYGTYVRHFDILQLTHHFYCLVGTVSIWWSGTCASSLVLGLFLTHLSSPFGYVRLFTKELNLRNTELSRFCKHAYFWIKVATILVVSPLVVFLILLSDFHNVVFKLCSVGVLVVNMIWLYTVGLRYAAND